MAIFGLKTAILDFKIAIDLSENIFIWTALKSYTSESSFIRFSAFLLWFQGPSHTVGDNASPLLENFTKLVDKLKINLNLYYTYVHIYIDRKS